MSNLIQDNKMRDCLGSLILFSSCDWTDLDEGCSHLICTEIIKAYGLCNMLTLFLLTLLYNKRSSAHTQFVSKRYDMFVFSLF